MWHWRTGIDEAIKLAKIAVDTCFWPLYEIENGKLTINYKPKDKKPITEWIKMQGRFKHLFKPENEQIIQRLQEGIDCKWESLLKREEFEKAC